MLCSNINSPRNCVNIKSQAQEILWCIKRYLNPTVAIFSNLVRYFIVANVKNCNCPVRVNANKHNFRESFWLE